MKIKLFSLIILIFLFGRSFANPEYYSPESVLQFADWLFTKGEYRRAASEYMRYLFINEKEPDDKILLKIGRCHSLSKEYEYALNIFNSILKDFPYSPFKQEVLYESAFIYFKTGLYNKSLDLLFIKTINSAGDGINSELIKEKYFLLGGINCLYLKNWETALILLGDPALEKSEYKDLKDKLIILLEKSKSYDKRNPVIAGILSAIIPGSGKMYAGKPWDGLFSLITISIFGGMAAYSFLEQGLYSVSGWTYTSLGGVFYLGNIFGSVLAAMHYNAKHERILFKETDDILKNFTP